MAANLEMFMTGRTDTPAPFLICKVGQRLCGFPLGHVIETMRRLPVEAFPGMLPCMTGMAIIRGARVPVVNLANLLGEDIDAEPTRYVTVKLDQRQAAFAVSSVSGVAHFSTDSQENLSPLLDEVGSGIVATIGTLDSRLFLVLDASRVLSEVQWQAVEQAGCRE